MHAIVALVWCGAVTARPAVLPCPMGGHGAGHDAHVASHAAHVDAETGRIAPTEHVPSAPAPAAPVSHPCDCLGRCSAAAIVAPAADSPVLATVEPAIDVWYPSDATAHRAAWTPFLLPFAIAPPRSSRS